MAGPDERVALVETALGEPLSRLPIQVLMSRATEVDPKTVVDRGASSSDAFVRVWVDLSRPEKVTLYFVDSAWERILVRNVPLERGLDEVEREEIAQIVRSAVEALLAGATIGISREEARAILLPETKPEVREVPRKPKKSEAKKPSPIPVPPPRRALAIEAGGFYEGELYAKTLWHGPGILAGVSTRDAIAFGGRLTLQYRLPDRVEGDRLGAEIQALSMRGLARLTFRDDGFGLCGALGMGADLTHTSPTRVSGTVVTGHPRWDAAFVARALGGGGLFFGELGIWAVLGADLDWIETRFVAERDGEKYTAIEVPRIRPFVGIDVTIALDKDD